MSIPEKPEKNVTVLSMNLSLFVPTSDITTVKNQEVS